VVQVEAAHLFRSRSYLLPACGRDFRRAPLLSLIGFNSMCQKNAGAEERNKRSKLTQTSKRPYSICVLAVPRSIEASRFRFNRRGKMVSARQLGCRRSFLDRVTAATRIQIAAKEQVAFAGRGSGERGRTLWIT